ncbi:MAG: cyclase family protein [Myxococcota bacterium]
MQSNDYSNYPRRFSNWGRWGPDDELGTLNFITPEVRREAVASVRSGRVVSLGRAIDTAPSVLNPYPAHHLASVGTARGTADYVGLFYHGFAQTHLDALSHIPDGEGRYFNGHAIGTRTPALVMPEGVSLGVQRMRDGIVSRGVLYDIPRLRGATCVQAGAPVRGSDLREAARAQGVEPRTGDVVCIYSGREAWLSARDGNESGIGAGVHASVCEFLYETDAAMLCWDMLEAPTEDQGIPNPMPIDVPVHVHCIAIPIMGMPLLDNADLRGLAALCRERDRWDFLFMASPLIIEGGTGSPVNPIAVL